MKIKYESAVIMVKDVGVPRQFYEGVLGQEVDLDFGPNVSFAGGRFAIWQVDHAHEIVFGESSSEVGQREMELYFETDDLDGVMQRLTDAQVEFVHPMREQPWGQRVVRLYDPDRHMVEVGEPMSVVVMRFLDQGMSAEQTAERTGMPVEVVRQTVTAGDEQIF